MSTTPRTIMIIGAGFISRASHASNLSRLPDGTTCTICVADPSAAAIEEFKKIIPRAETFTDYKTMLASRPATQDDIVIVATAPFLHRQMALNTFASGRHVLCEKPLGMNRTEGREMLAAAKKAGKLLGCCSARVANSAVTMKVNEFVTSGKLGEVYHATMVLRQPRSRTGIEYQPTSRFFLDKSKNGGGPVFDWGPYEFNTMVDALTPDKIEVIQAWMTRPETEIDPKDCVFDVEEHVGATMRFSAKDRKPVIVDYERAFCTHGDESNQSPITFQIEGTRGAVKWEWINDGTGRICHSYDKEGTRVTDEISITRSDEEGMHSKPIVYFDKAIRGEKCLTYINETALFNFELLCSIYECVESGKIQTLEKK